MFQAARSCTERELLEICAERLSCGFIHFRIDLLLCCRCSITAAWSRGAREMGAIHECLGYWFGMR